MRISVRRGKMRDLNPRVFVPRPRNPFLDLRGTFFGGPIRSRLRRLEESLRNRLVDDDDDAAGLRRLDLI